MTKRFSIVGLALLSSLAVSAGSMSHAATSSTLDILPSDVTGVPADRVDVSPLKLLAGPKQRETAKPPVSGNPLWSVPLSVLTATQERPIFSASRRPPPRAVAGPFIPPVVVPVVAKPAEPEQPPLVLIGAVVGDNDAIAVFLDRTNQGFVRLRAGETHAPSGWVLSSVMRREVTVKKADQTEVLALQRQDTPGSPIPGLPALMPAAAAAAAAAGGAGSFVPFVPRSTPKNGESDGL